MDPQLTMVYQILFEKLLGHVGHDIEIVTYGTTADVDNVSVECLDCGAVIVDADHPEVIHANAN